MKVWVLLIQHPNIVDVLGVYDSLEKAILAKVGLAQESASSHCMDRYLMISEQLVF